MKLDTAFLRSKVARRVFLLFILCALLPITVLAIVSFSHVTTELHEQSQKRLHEASKAVGMAIYERLLLLEGELKLLVRDLEAGRRVELGPTSQLGEELSSRLDGLLALKEGAATPLFGRPFDAPELSQEERGHLAAGHTLVKTLKLDGPLSRVLLIRRVDPLAGQPHLLIADVNGAYLWGLGKHETLPANTEMCVLVGLHAVHVCSLQGPLPFRERLAFAVSEAGPSHLEWEHQGEPYLGSFWSIPLKFRFHSPAWTVVLSEPEAVAFAPMANFKYTFSMVVLLSVWVVSLVSLVQIRRNLVPLEKLREGTRRIANKDFASHVTVESGDEFQELATSFNTMADQLAKQFKTLATISEIDRAVLSTLDSQNIIGIVLTRVKDVLPCDAISMTLRDEQVPEVGWTHLRTEDSPDRTIVEPVQLTLDVLQQLHESQPHLFYDGRFVPAFLEPLTKRGLRSFVVLPLIRAERVSGFIALGYRHTSKLDRDDHEQARQLANQVAAALANADDVAQRRRAEAGLLESNTRLEQALDELKSTQQQMIQQERLRALGQMASGIAHDFNNTLSPIVGFSELMLLNSKTLDNKEKVMEHLRIINTAARDATRVVGHLRDFYRKRVQEDVSGSVALNHLVEQTMKLTQPKWKDQALAAGVTIRFETDLQEVPAIAGNESELREVLTNLIFNAVDAMPESGTLALRTRQEGDRVLLEVSDSGTGMSAEVRQQCLEPFFSTKGERGTGLGLSMVYAIIRRHHGAIDIESEPGKGTTFRLRLPIQSSASHEAPAADTLSLWKTLHVLVVDDDPLVGRVTTEYLTAMGYTAETAANGPEALKVFSPERFGLVMTDQGMPGMSGDRLAHAIKKRSPTTPVIMLTGAGQMADGEAPQWEAVDVHVNKPLTMDSLRHALAKAKAWRESIDSHSKAASGTRS